LKRYPNSFTTFIQQNAPTWKSKSGLNLLTSMLEYDPKRRITAEEALDHPYFKVIIIFIIIITVYILILYEEQLNSHV